MNSKSKFEENQQDAKSDPVLILSDRQILDAKIQYQIRQYDYRLYSNKEELELLKKVDVLDYSNFEMLDIWRLRKEFLMDDIEFCRKQINAYKTGNDKAKVIPDRLL